MTMLKRRLQMFRSINLSNRQVAVFAVFSGLLLMGLMVTWLTMSTRTALLDRQLEQLDQKQTTVTDEINQTWTVIGDVTSPKAMEDRARRLGYKPAEKIDYLVITPNGTLTATVVMTATAK